MDESFYTLLPWLIAGIITGLFMKLIPEDKTLIEGFPVLGNVVALGRLGCSFINRCRLQFGDVFTLNLCGKYMTFIHDRDLIENFFKAPDSEITFRPAVEQFTQRVFGLPSKTFFPKHSQILKDLRHLLVPSELHAHGTHLADKVHQLMSSVLQDGKQIDLFDVVKELIFTSAVEVLFGNNVFKCVPGGAKEMQITFFEFEQAFELAASPFPHVLQPTFTRARANLLKWLKLTYEAEGFRSTPAGQLMERSGLESSIAPNMLLAVLWASQANTVPATFWALAFLFLPENKKYATSILDELKQEVINPAKSSGDTNPGTQSTATIRASIRLALDRRSTISKCVAEAIRLRVHSIDLRIASADLDLTTSTGIKVHLPKGRLLAICPFESHHDESLYTPDPWAYDPDRQPLALGDGTAVQTSLAGLAFGGGSYRCPGRFFAEMEVGVVVQMMLQHYNLDLVKQSPVVNVSEKLVVQNLLIYQVFHAFFQMMGNKAIWGLGLFGEEQTKEEGSDKLETWRSSGDKACLLPPVNLHRLVGLKVPAAPCLVKVSRKM